MPILHLPEEGFERIKVIEKLSRKKERIINDQLPNFLSTVDYNKATEQVRRAHFSKLITEH